MDNLLCRFIRMVLSGQVNESRPFLTVFEFKYIEVGTYGQSTSACDEVAVTGAVPIVVVRRGREDLVSPTVEDIDGIAGVGIQTLDDEGFVESVSVRAKAFGDTDVHDTCIGVEPVGDTIIVAVVCNTIVV